MTLSGIPKSAFLFLVLITIAVGYAVLFAGVPIAQAHGELRQQGLISILLIGIVGLLYAVAGRTRSIRGCGLPHLIVLLPAYAVLQVVPLPLQAVRVLSPARAELVSAFGKNMPDTSWLSLSVAPSETLYHCWLLLACAVVLLVVLHLARSFSAHPWVVVLPLMLLAAGEAALGIAQVAANPEIVATGTYAIRNHYAGFLEMVLPFPVVFVFLAWTMRRRSRAGELVLVSIACGSFATAALIFAAIILSSSRMGFLAAIVTVAFIAAIALARGRSTKQVLWVGTGIASLAIVAVVLLPSARLVARFGEIETTKEARSPVQETLNLFAAYPLFGCGLGTYESAFLKYKSSNFALNQDYAHNDYLQYLAELGIVGFAIVLAGLILIVMGLLRGVRQNSIEVRLLSLACLGSILAIAMHSLVDFNLYVPANLFTLAWVLGISAYMGLLASKSVGHTPAAVIAVPVTPA